MEWSELLRQLKDLSLMFQTKVQRWQAYGQKFSQELAEQTVRPLIFDFLSHDLLGFASC